MPPLASWSFQEYQKQNRSQAWYITTVIALGLMLSYAIITYNFLFVIFLILTVIILILQIKNKPKRVRCEITAEGVKVGRNFYKYDDLDIFWIIYQPPKTKNLFFEFKNKFKMRLAIPLGSQNPIKIRQILLEYLDEDLEKEEEPVSDTFGRMLKI